MLLLEVLLDLGAVRLVPPLEFRGPEPDFGQDVREGARALPAPPAVHLPLEERIFIELMTSDCKLKASKEGSR